jgi:hypothetical protein
MNYLEKLSRIHRIAGILLTFFLALAANAALPPLDEAERLAKSDLVITGRIVSIADLGLEELKRPTDRTVIAVLHTYRASIKVLTVEKGEAKVGAVVQVGYHQTANGPPGPQGQNQLLPEQGDVRVFLRNVSGSSPELVQPNGWEPIPTP